MSKLARAAQRVLDKNHRQALAMAERTSLAKTKKLLEQAAAELRRRIYSRVGVAEGDTFTSTQMRATLAQVEATIKSLNSDLKTLLLADGSVLAEQAADHTAKYLKVAEKAFRGTGSQPLAIREAAMLDRAARGARGSILHRLSQEGGPRGMGVLQRYGVETIGHFERKLQLGLIQRKSFAEMREDITKKSPFLQDALAHWATRIVRTELAGARNRGAWESIREADDQLGDMVKILSAVFDERTAADSYATHGQIRRPDDPFETWFGLLMHPPDRPNDRGSVVPHRISWPLPPYLQARDPAEVEARWELEKHKDPMPEIPEISTVDLSLFGRAPPPKLRHRGESESDESESDSGEAEDET